jgi:hypothetical protein
MKKLAILFIFLFASRAYSQGFEGTIHWTMKMEITDPQRKAQIEEAQKKMSDPATQAQMKQMQEKMNDPQFKAMLESNPQMKAQIEKAITAMSSGNVNSMFPTGLIIQVKNNDLLSKMEGGMFGLETLYLKDKNQTYTLDRDNKTYSVMKTTDKPESAAGAGNEAKVTKTSETAKIMNYTCTKYIVEHKIHNETYTQFIWATKEIKDIDLKALGKQRMGKDYQLYVDKIDGVPLRVEMKTKEAAMSMEVNQLKKESVPASTFAIPADFKEVPSMFGN